MEPRIQYAQTSDGVSIACWSIGEGLPVIGVPPVPFTHLQMEWDDPSYRAWDERLAHGKRYIRYDNRGSGLSDREVSDYSLEGLILDIDAVADRLGLDRFVLAGISLGASIAIAYAARRPERVSHLILWCPYAATGKAAGDPGHAIMSTREKDWELFTEMSAHALVAGWSAGDQAHRFARLMREAVPHGGSPLEHTVRHVDSDAELAHIRCPTLILHRRGARYPPPEAAKRMTARIPGAELVLLEGEALLPFVGDMEAAASAVDSFLGIEAQAPVAAPSAPTGSQAGALATILFTDVEGSTALTQRMGDVKAREVLREHERITRECLRAHGGSEVKTMGDGFMASFGSATKAIECAIAIQQAFEERNRGVGALQPGDQMPTVQRGMDRTSDVATVPAGAAPIRVRIGLNAGEPIAEADPGGRGDLFGTAVNMAARIAAQARGGEILVSDVVRQLVAGKGFLFSDRGEQVLRGLEDPVRVYDVRWSFDSPSAATTGGPG
jgi:class 3 adenylate cyclase